MSSGFLRLVETALFSRRVMKSCKLSFRPRSASSSVGSRSDIHLPMKSPGDSGAESLNQRLHAAALGMAQHNDVFDVQHLHREFQRRRNAVRGAIRSIGRHQISDVAHHKQFAWSDVENHLGETRRSQQPITIVSGDCPFWDNSR